MCDEGALDHEWVATQKSTNIKKKRMIVSVFDKLKVSRVTGAELPRYHPLNQNQILYRGL